MIIKLLSKKFINLFYYLMIMNNKVTYILKNKFRKLLKKVKLNNNYK
jgi:hypothetical protein